MQDISFESSSTVIIFNDVKNAAVMFEHLPNWTSSVNKLSYLKLFLMKSL